MIKSFLVVSFQILRVFRGRKFWKISNSNNNLEKSCTEVENREFKNITTLVTRHPPLGENFEDQRCNLSGMEAQ